MERIDCAAKQLRKRAAHGSRLSAVVFGTALGALFIGAPHSALARNNATAAAQPAAQADHTRISSGKTLYGTACVFCHGVDGRGSAAAPALVGHPLTGKSVTDIVTN